MATATSSLSAAYATPAAQNNNPAAITKPQEAPSKKAEKQKTFNAETFTLDNGMQVIVIPNHRAPVVTQMVWYKAGAADEPHGHSGIAHFLEHLMFKGSGNLAPGEFSKDIKKMGGQDNAFTSQDYTAYFQTVSVDHLEDVMKMESARMRGAHPPEKQVESEHLVVLEERRQRTDNNPRNHFYERINYALYPNHPYGTPVLGWKKEMEAMDWEAAKAFYDRWYEPNNAVLVVSGDITAAQLKPLAEETYGKIPRADVPKRVRPAIPPMPGDTLLTLSDPSVHDRQFLKACRVPSDHQDKKTSLALQVLEDIMSNGSTSRLYKQFVINEKLASSAGMSYQGGALDTGSLWFSATVKGSDISFGEIQKSYKKALEDIAEKGVSAKELNASKMRLKDEAVYARDSLQGPAMLFGYTLTTGGTIDDVEYWPEDIDTVTAADIQNAVKSYLMDDTRCVTAYIEPSDPNAANGKNPPPASIPMMGGMVR